MGKDLLLTLYARYERSIEGTASARDRDVTLWRKAKPSDFPHMTRKLIRKHQYHDFESLRSTDLDFEPLQQNEDYLKMLEEEQKRVQEEKTQEDKQ